MWRTIAINGEVYYFLVNIDDDTADVVMFNTKDIFCSQEKLVDIYERVRTLNRRIQFSKESVNKALMVERPVEGSMEDKEGDAIVTKLQLKFSICTRPMRIEFYMQRQPKAVCLKTMIFPLFRVINELCEQIEDLRTVIANKDQEIKQYRFEFGELTRKTVATCLFDFEAFDRDHDEIIEWCKTALEVRRSTGASAGASAATYVDTAVGASPPSLPPPPPPPPQQQPQQQQEAKRSDFQSTPLTARRLGGVRRVAIDCMPNESDASDRSKTSSIKVEPSTSSKTTPSPRNRKRAFKAQYERSTMRGRKLKFEYPPVSGDDSDADQLSSGNRQTTDNSEQTEAESPTSTTTNTTDKASENLGAMTELSNNETSGAEMESNADDDADADDNEEFVPLHAENAVSSKTMSSIKVVLQTKRAKFQAKAATWREESSSGDGGAGGSKENRQFGIGLNVNTVMFGLHRLNRRRRLVVDPFHLRRQQQRQPPQSQKCMPPQRRSTR